MRLLALENKIQLLFVPSNVYRCRAEIIKCGHLVKIG